MILDALNASRRCTMYTFDPYLVKKLASSMAESPPPMTAIGLLRKIGAAPSHTAHAEIPRFHKVSEPGNLSRLATAPVATITESAKT